MYCPNCGTKISMEQKYCRACGLGLEKIAQSIAEQLPTTLDENLGEQKDKFERWGVIALSIFGVGVLSVPLYYIVKIMLAGKVLAGLGYLALIIVLGCGVLSAILFAKAKEVEEAKAKRRAKPPKEQVEEATTKNLLSEGYLEPIPSVTDGTTELLYAEKKGAVKEG